MEKIKKKWKHWTYSTLATYERKWINLRKFCFDGLTRLRILCQLVRTLFVGEVSVYSAFVSRDGFRFPGQHTKYQTGTSTNIICLLRCTCLPVIIRCTEYKCIERNLLNLVFVTLYMSSFVRFNIYELYSLTKNSTKVGWFDLGKMKRKLLRLMARFLRFLNKIYGIYGFDVFDDLMLAEARRKRRQRTKPLCRIAAHWNRCFAASSANINDFTNQ